jgi:TolB-like protein/class 3 adenylate cyclase/Flp pilus assembly protein TadD
VQRRLTTILAADIAGFSRLIGLDEEGTLTAQRAHRTELINPLLERYDGRVANTAGDSLLIEFPSAVQAVRCALAMQEGITHRNAAVPAERRIEYRIGINVGDVVAEEGDLLGDGVNVAARLESIAPAGGIILSRAARDQVRDRLALELADLGEVSVKNIARPVRAFEVLRNGETAAGAQKKPNQHYGVYVAAATVFVLMIVAAFFWQARDVEDQTSLTKNAAVVSVDRPSIAVLPFSNISNDSDQEYFVDGMTEDLITDLAKIESLFVIARNTVFTYKGKPVAVPDVARELGVRFVLEGSVRRVGNAVRINAQLIDGANGAHVWAERYDGDLADIFALQDKVTSEIVAQLQITLRPGEQKLQGSKGTDNVEAHDAYLRGWQLYRRHAPEAFAEAIPHLMLAVELDPDYGQAWAALASIYWISYRKGESWTLLVNPNAHNMVSVIGSRDKAEIYLRKAKRNPTPLAYQVESQISWDYRQYDRALGEARQAIALNQNDPAGHLALAMALIFAGSAEDAIASAKTALQLDPNFPGTSLFVLGTSQVMLERYDEAKATLTRALTFLPDESGVLVPLGIAYAKTGQRAEAVAALKKHHSFSIFAAPKIEHYMTWWPFKRESDNRLFGGGLIEAGMCCQNELEAYIDKLRRGGTLD